MHVLLYLLRSCGNCYLLFLLVSSAFAQADGGNVQKREYTIHEPAIEIITPRRKEVADAVPVTVELRFNDLIEAGSFKARLNRQDVSDRFILRDDGATAQLDVIDGLNIQRTRADGTARNFLVVEARVGDKHGTKRTGKTVFAKRKFFVQDDVVANRAVTISGFYDDLETPAQAGASVFINGDVVGSLNDDGQFRTTLPIDQVYFIRLVETGLAASGSELVLAANSPADVGISIIMTSEDGLLEDAALEAEGIDDDILASDFTDLSLRFIKPDGDPAVLVSFSYIDLISPTDEDVKINVSDDFFVATDGSLKLSDVEAFRSAVLSLPMGRIRLQVGSANDALGLLYGGEVSFYVGRYFVDGTLAAPPSNTSLPVGGVEVKAAYLASDIILTAVSDAGGAFSFGPLPIGNWEFSAFTASDELTYSSAATIIVDLDKMLTLNLLTTIDIINNVPPYSVQNDLRLVPERTAADGTVSVERQHGKKTLQGIGGVPAMALQTVQTTDGNAFVEVTSGSQDVPISDSATLKVPRGTERVYLNYEVYTAEYLDFVLQQSIYNDVWRTLVLTASGQQLFSIVRQVNSQLNAAPVWQSNGSTGVITEEFDVSELAADDDIELTLFASATNIGDSYWWTTVSAQLVFEPSLRINDVTNDTVMPTDGDSSYYSIPRSGAINTYDRKYTLKLVRPQGSTITNVTADLQQFGGGQLDELVNEAPGGTLVREVDDETLEVTVTMTESNASGLNSTPPPLHNILYAFTVTADLDDGTSVRVRRDSAPRHALWRMPDGVPRFGGRDSGGDDWGAKGTYEWILDNSALFTRTFVNDISGEHARDIGHATHARGTDIDIYHFVNLLAGVPNGTKNYLSYRNEVVAAMGGDQKALQTVTNWVSIHRDEFDALIAMPEVAAVISPNGAASGNLMDGWARTLMTAGRLMDKADNSIDTGLGSWSNDSVRYRNDHNNHIHIDMSDSALNNLP